MLKRIIELGFLLLSLPLIGVCQQPNQQSLTLVAPSPSAPSNIGATIIGPSGNTSYYYWVVATYPVGKSTIAGPVSVLNGPNTLSPTNYINVSWSPTTSAISYDLLRTTTPTQPSTTATIQVMVITGGGTSWNDIGAALTTYTPSTQSDVKGTMAVNNLDLPIPAFVFTLPIFASAYYGDGSHLTGIVALPSQVGNAGRFLTTDGANASWSPNLLVDNLFEVDTTSASPDDVLGFNGSKWVPKTLAAPGSTGSGTVLFKDDTTIIPIGGNNDNQVNTLSKTPITTAEVVDSINAVSNTVRGESYLYNTALGITSIPSGIWVSNLYASVSSTGGGRVSSLTNNVFSVTPDTNTVTTSGGPGTSRTATASGGTPFAVTNIDPSATGTVASYLQTPQGLYQITARADDQHITITVPATYANEVGVAMSIWKKLFGFTTPTITATGTNYTLIQVSSVQPAFTVSATAKLGEMVFGTSNNTTTLFYTHNGNQHYSNFQSTLTSNSSVIYKDYVVAKCSSAVAAGTVSLPPANAPTASCVTGVDTPASIWATLQFANTATQSIQDHFTLPTSLPISVDFSGKWRSAVANAGLNVIWQVRTKCVADGVTEDSVAWNAVQQITDANKAVANQENDFGLFGLTMTGCNVGSEFHWYMFRDPTADTLGATAELISVRFKLNF